MSTYEKISKDYTIDENGIIKSPGKFESEHWSTVDLWESVLDGSSDDSYDLGDTVYDGFALTDDDRTKYGFEPFIYGVVLHEDSQGFVVGVTCTEQEYNAWMEQGETYESDGDF